MPDSHSLGPREAHTSLKPSHPASNQVEAFFESIVFASRWIQAPLYAGLIMAELL